jgi:hypothetical protein
MPLHPDHIEDLHKSALSDATIEMMGCRSVLGADCTAISPIFTQCRSLLEIPYLLNNGFRRYKTFPPIETESGTMRYFQPPGSENHLYVLPPIAEKLHDTREALYIIEGEKKTASLVERGYAAIGIGGLWNWKETESWEGISELKSIPFLKRDAVIVPDSDIWTQNRTDLQKAVYTLGKYLELAGAKVSVLALPQGQNKIGADDYFAAGHTVDEFEQLPRLPLKDPPLAQHKNWYDSWKRRLEEEQRKQAAVSNEKEPISDEELNARAESILKEPDVLELYRKEFRRLGYGGDLTPVLIVLLAMTTRLLKLQRGNLPAHLGIIGPPSIGKSYTNQIVLSVLPPEAFYVIDAGSPRTLIYNHEPLKHRVLCFAESDSLPAGEDNPAASAIRNLCQDHFLHYEVVIKGESEFTTQEIIKEGPTLLVTTAVRFLGGQLGTRLFLVEVPEDVKRLQEAIKTQARLEIDPPSEPSAALIAFQEILQRKAPIDVVVPFAPDLGDAIAKSASAPRILRDFQRILSLIKAAALLHFNSRESGEDGRLRATIDDYASVYDLVNEMYKTTVSEVSKGVRAAVEKVRELENAKVSSITYSVIAENLRIHRQQAKRVVDRAIEQGWLINKQDKKNHPADLTILGAEPMPEKGGLPEPSFLRGMVLQCDRFTNGGSGNEETPSNFNNLPSVTPEDHSVTHQAQGVLQSDRGVTSEEVSESINKPWPSSAAKTNLSHCHTQPRKEEEAATFSASLPASLDRFTEIFALDFEFHCPDGANPEPHCLVAYEIRSSRTLKLLREDFPAKPPYSVSSDALALLYSGASDLRCHLALGWPLPENYIDLGVEAKLQFNTPLGPDRGFPGLVEILDRLGIAHIDPAEKKKMQKRCAKPALTAEDRREILPYCQTDVVVLPELFIRLLPGMDIDQALERGAYVRETAVIEQRGIPISASEYDKIAANRKQIRLDLIKSSPVGPEIYNEKGSFVHKRFAAWLDKNGIENWQRTDKSDRCCLSEEYIQEVAAVAPAVQPFLDLVLALKDFKKCPFGIGPDARTHADQIPFGTISGRNAPSGFVLVCAKFWRWMVRAPEGMALIYCDYSNEEFATAAFLSGDENMISGYALPDVYQTVADQLGVSRKNAKVAMLATQYGAGPRRLADSLGIPYGEAEKVFNYHKQTYSRYWKWSYECLGELKSKGVYEVPGDRWALRFDGADSENRDLLTARNFPIQATAAAILRQVVIDAPKQGIEIVGPLHDAVLIQAPSGEARKFAKKTCDLMRDVSRRILGHEIRVASQIYLDRFEDKDGKEDWLRISTLLKGY